MMTEQIFAQAVLLAGPLTAQQKELLKVFCQTAGCSLVNRLRDGITAADCRTDFVAAASLYGLAALREAGQDESVEEFRAGDLTVKRNGKDGSARCLRQQADEIIRPFLKDRFSFAGV